MRMDMRARMRCKRRYTAPQNTHTFARACARAHVDIASAATASGAGAGCGGAGRALAPAPTPPLAPLSAAVFLSYARSAAPMSARMKRASSNGAPPATAAATPAPAPALPARCSGCCAPAGAAAGSAAAAACGASAGDASAAVGSSTPKLPRRSCSKPNALRRLYAQRDCAERTKRRARACASAHSARQRSEKRAFSHALSRAHQSRGEHGMQRGRLIYGAVQAVVHRQAARRRHGRRLRGCAARRSGSGSSGSGGGACIKQRPLLLRYDIESRLRRVGHHVLEALRAAGQAAARRAVRQRARQRGEDNTRAGFQPSRPLHAHAHMRSQAHAYAHARTHARTHAAHVPLPRGRGAPGVAAVQARNKRCFVQAVVALIEVRDGEIVNHGVTVQRVGGQPGGRERAWTGA